MTWMISFNILGVSTVNNQANKIRVKQKYPRRPEAHTMYVHKLNKMSKEKCACIS